MAYLVSLPTITIEVVINEKLYLVNQSEEHMLFEVLDNSLKMSQKTLSATFKKKKKRLVHFVVSFICII